MKRVLIFISVLLASTVIANATPVRFTWTSTVNYDSYGIPAREGELFTATLVFNNGSSSMANQTWTVEDLRSIEYRTSGGWSDGRANLKLFAHYSGGWSDGRSKRAFAYSNFSTDAFGNLATRFAGFFSDSRQPNYATWLITSGYDVYRSGTGGLVVDPNPDLGAWHVSQIPLPAGGLLLLSSSAILLALRRKRTTFLG